jgi:hypothetical protein
MSKSVFEIASIIASTGKSFGILHYSQQHLHYLPYLHRRRALHCWPHVAARLSCSLSSVTSLTALSSFLGSITQSSRLTAVAPCVLMT